MKFREFDGSETEIDPDELLTFEQWWREWEDHKCCPSSSYAILTDCGCGGSGSLPEGMSRLLLEDLVV